MATVEIHSGDLYTVTTGDEIKYYTDAEEGAMLIIANMTYLLFRTEDDELLFTLDYSQNENLQVYSNFRLEVDDIHEYFDVRPVMKHIPVVITITLNEDTGDYFRFTVAITQPPDGTDDEFPQDWQNTMYAKLNSQAAKPVKPFSEFNDDHNRWIFYDNLSRRGWLDRDDFPPEPKVEDYS